MEIRANCKINIGLDILDRRADGFHNLCTVMYPVKGLYDTINVEKIDSADVEFIGKGLMVDCCAEDNLCIKAFRLIDKQFGQITPVRITLDKQIPFGAGLGGGSSDATAVIMALDKLFNLDLTRTHLLHLAAELGSDTAFFVHNTPQLCTRRGEVMSPIELDLSGKYLVMIKPEVFVSTKQAYAGVTPAEPTTPLDELISLPIEKWQGVIKNDFEPHIFEAYPELKRIKEEMLEAGALYAAMSGSGSTIYGIFQSEEKAKSEQLESYSPYIFAL